MKKILSLIVMIAAFMSTASAQTFAPLYGTRLELKNGSYKLRIYPPTFTSSYDLVMPTGAGSTGQVLVLLDNLGNLGWTTPSGSGTVTNVDGAGSNGLTLTGGPITGTGTLTVGITANGIAYGSIQQVAAGRLLGNSTGSPATIEEISVGSGLSLSGGVLSATGGGVTSVEGTPDQVLVNGSDNTQETGDVVLSLPQSIGTGSSPQFTGLNLSGLTPSALVATNGSGDLVSYVTTSLQAFATAITGTLGSNNGGTGLNDAALNTNAGMALVVNGTEDGYTFASLGGGGTVTSVAANSPLSITGVATVNPTVNIADADADGTTKGAASFTAADFDASSGNISIDYTNGQIASGSQNGFLSSGSFTTFTNKQNAITFRDLTSSDITVTNGTGAVTGAANTTLTIANDAVTFAKMQNSAAAGLSVVGRNTNSAGDFAEINAANDGEVLRRSGTALGFGTIATAGIGDDQVTLGKIANAAASSKLVGSGATGSGANYVEITLGTNLSMSGTTLNATGGGGTAYLSWGGNSRNTNLDNSSITYSSLHGTQNFSTTQVDHEIIIPVACTITAIYVRLDGTPGSGNDYTFDVMNLTTPANSGTVVVSDSEVADSNTGLSLSCAAGDRVVFRCDPNSSPTGRDCYWGIRATVP